MNEIVVSCPVCAFEAAALVAAAGLVLDSHLVPGTKFPCPQGGTMLTSYGEGTWRRQRAAASAAPPGCP